MTVNSNQLMMHVADIHVMYYLLKEACSDMHVNIISDSSLFNDECIFKICLRDLGGVSLQLVVP